jgi:hypothetical protein
MLYPNEFGVENTTEIVSNQVMDEVVFFGFFHLH